MAKKVDVKTEETACMPEFVFPQIGHADAHATIYGPIPGAAVAGA